MRLTHLLTAGALALAATLPAQSTLTTTFADNNGGSPGWMNFFDVQLNIGVSIVAFDLNISSTAAATGTIDVYVTAPGGTHVGNEQNSGAWTLVGSSQPFTGAGTGQRTNAALVNPIVLAPGQYGIGILYNGASARYTDGIGTNQTYSNADMTLQLGSSIAGQFTGTLFNPRVWNGTIYYFAGSNFARAIPYGSGCGATGAPLGLRGVARPVIGTTASAETTNIPAGSQAAFLMFGFVSITPGFDLTPAGMPGCELLVGSSAVLSTTPSGSTQTFQLAVPNNRTLAGASIYLQSVAVDLGGNALGLITSNGLEWVLDTQ